MQSQQGTRRAPVLRDHCKAGLRKQRLPARLAQPEAEVARIRGAPCARVQAPEGCCHRPGRLVRQQEAAGRQGGMQVAQRGCKKKLHDVASSSGVFCRLKLRMYVAIHPLLGNNRALKLTV
jgi:hypothetical protein